MARPAKPKPAAFNPPKGRMPVPSFVPPSELRIDPDYQRKIDGSDSQRLIQKIARDWDWALCLPLVVSNRGGAGDLFVIDGQHRLEAARLRGDILQLPCVVVTYADAKAEAGAFVALNQVRRALSALEIFRAAVASGDAEAIEIERRVEAEGLSIARHTNNKHWQPGQIGNVAGLRSAARKHGMNKLSAALRVLARAYDGERIAYAGTIFPGIMAVVAARLQQATVDLPQALAEIGQAKLYDKIMRARGDDPLLNIERASAQVVDAVLRKVRCEPDPAAGRPIDIAQFEQGRAWCSQCDMRVTIAQAGGCKSRFCPLKQAAAA